MLTRTQKEESIAELREKLARATSVFVADYRGLSVQPGERAARQAPRGGRGYEYQVAKNTLLRRAAGRLGRGRPRPTASRARPPSRSPSATRCALAKVLVDYAKENEKFKLKGGFMDGQPLGPAEIATVATLPSLDELRGKLVGLLQAPAQKLRGAAGGARRAAGAARRGAARQAR